MDRDEYDPNSDESGKWLSAIIGLLGVWMMVGAFAFDTLLTQFWNDILAGALLLAVGTYNYNRRRHAEIGSVAAASVAALIGVWLVMSPVVFGTDAGLNEAANDLTFWNDVVVGLIAIVLGVYSAYEASDERRELRRTGS